MQRDYQGIVLFGPPGVGKGAQASILSRSKGLMHLATGELIREEIRIGTRLGRRVKEAVDRGQFADDSTVLGIVMARIDRPEFQEGFVMDGFPRNVPQAEMLHRLLAERGLRVTHALFMDCPDEVVLRRLSGRRVCSRCKATFNEEFKRSRIIGICDDCGGHLTRRHDDDPATHRERIAIYHQVTQPLAEHYGKEGICFHVDGNQPIEKVSQDIEKILQNGSDS